MANLKQALAGVSAAIMFLVVTKPADGQVLLNLNAGGSGQLSAGVAGSTLVIGGAGASGAQVPVQLTPNPAAIAGATAAAAVNAAGFLSAPTQGPFLGTLTLPTLPATAPGAVAQAGSAAARTAQAAARAGQAGSALAQRAAGLLPVPASGGAVPSATAAVNRLTNNGNNALNGNASNVLSRAGSALPAPLPGSLTAPAVPPLPDAVGAPHAIGLAGGALNAARSAADAALPGAGAAASAVFQSDTTGTGLITVTGDPLGAVVQTTSGGSANGLVEAGAALVR